MQDSGSPQTFKKKEGKKEKKYKQLHYQLEIKSPIKVMYVKRQH